VAVSVERRSALAALADLLQSAAPRDFDTWLSAALPQVAALVDADGALATFADPDGGGRGAWGQPLAAPVGPAGTDPPPGGGDLAEFVAAPSRFGDFAAVLAVPIRFEGRRVGSLLLGWRRPPGDVGSARLHTLAVAASYLGSARSAHRLRERATAAEREASRLGKLYRALSQCNQAIVRAEAERDLLAGVCRAAAEYADLSLAWLGFVDPAGERVAPEVWCGGPAWLVRRLRTPQRSAELMRAPGLVARALREGRVCVLEDLPSLGGAFPWPDEARRAGYGSYAVAPVEDGKRRGVLALYARERGFFSERDRDLLAELAHDLGYGLRALAARRELERSLGITRTVFEAVQDGLMLTDGAGRILSANPAAADMFGRPAQELQQLTAASLLDESGRQAIDAALRRLRRRRRGVAALEVNGRRADGSLFPLAVSVAEAGAREGRRIVGVLRDLTASRKAEARAAHMASHDPVTGALIRAGLRPGLERLLKAASPTATRAAVAILDLDRFSDVNDGYGHAAGDRLLAAMARRLRRFVGPDGIVVRYGSDEFALAVLLPAATSAERWAMQVRRQAERAVRLGQDALQLSASVGVAVAPDDGQDADSLLNRARFSLSAVKDGGGHGHRVFSAELERAREARRGLSHRLRAAVAAGELVLHYQPQVDMAGCEVRAVEALLRWQDPEGGLRLPGAFLPQLRDPRVIGLVGDWVIRHALAQWRRWLDQGLSLRVAVNVAPEQFLAPDFATRLRRELWRAGALGRQALELEVTESAALRDVDQARRVAERCRAMGVTMALDDFGTGYASIAYLQQLPLDVIKMDMGFTQAMVRDARSWSIAQSILEMGLAAGRTVVAEGVETAAHREALLRIGVRYGQGFYCLRPVPPEDLASWLRARAKRAGAARRTTRATGGAAAYATLVGLHATWLNQVLTASLHEGVVAPEEVTAPAAPCAVQRWAEGQAEGRPDIRRLVEMHVACHDTARRLLAARPGAEREALRNALTREQDRFLTRALEVLCPSTRRAPRRLDGERGRDAG
jgi:diguanylate cyclase (GGDEF)-like protein/PAS domain S-box-containing protein